MFSCCNAAFMCSIATGAHILLLFVWGTCGPAFPALQLCQSLMEGTFAQRLCVDGEEEEEGASEFKCAPFTKSCCILRENTCESLIK